MKSRNILLYSIVSVLSFWCFVSAVNVDSQIENELNKKEQEEMIQKTQDLSEKITFTQVTSCQDMEKVMEDFLETYKRLHPKIEYDYHIYRKGGGDWALNWMVVEETAMVGSIDANTNTFSEQSVSVSSDKWKISDYSTTNIQKMWVDEPEILKSNWKYLFYYSEVNYDDKYISIIKTPTEKDLSDAELVAKITIPDSLDNIQLFLNWDKLIILGSRYDNKSDSILWSSRTLVIIYDISDLENLKMEKMTEVYWYFEDARMIDDQVYLISSVNLDWYEIAWRDRPIKFKDMQPQLVDVTLRKWSNFLRKILGWNFMYKKKIVSMPCDSIFYLLPSEETMKETNTYPSFTLISQISLSDLSATPKQDLVFGNVDEIHMSQTSLYLPSPIYFSHPIKCKHWGCYSYWSYRDENTLVHKFNLWKTLSYQDSTIIPWTPLNQYSMDEDDDWNFRILTTTWYDQRATHLSILDNGLKLKWSLLNIEPGENFKSSRYIWDKLYLVTYQNIDPLFVVDMEDITNPKIIWELKIPGYSTYLHPYSDAKNWVQYLIWLGYSTTDNWYWWLKNDNVKVDLYKIDYNWHETAETKCSSLITKNVDAELTGLCTKACTKQFCYAEYYDDPDLSSAIKSMWLRSTYCPNIFCQNANDDWKYENLKHYYWDSYNKEMVLIPDVYSVSSSMCNSYDKKYWWKSCNEEQRLYEDCLTKVNPENIAVSVIASYEFTWDSNYSPALDNPRVFVRRSNKQELVLPMTISTTTQQWTRDNNRRYKYNVFLWLKWLSIKTSTALITEVLSQNFVEWESDDNYRCRRDSYDARVWYIDDTYYYLIWGFAWFLNKDWDVVTIGSLE